jgi:hypothetical protein
MTNDQINQRIAEACGWIEVGECENGGFRLRGFPPDRYEAHRKPIPNYCTDLNAMAEAESTMTQLQWAYFVAKLAELTRQPGRCDIPAQILLQARSRQRAEAFLKAVEKWEVAQ